MALCEAERHWRAFLKSLQTRGLRGATFIVSDDHAGLKAARRATFGAATWQRCQCHLAQNAVQHGPANDIRKRIGKHLGAIWNASSLQAAEAEQGALLASSRDKHPDFADGLETMCPRGSLSSPCPTPAKPDACQTNAHIKRHRATNPAGTQAAHIQGQGLSKPRSFEAPCNRNARRNRRKMGNRNQGI